MDTALKSPSGTIKKLREENDFANRLTCPKCGGRLTYVKESRPFFLGHTQSLGIRRRRVCSGCSERSTTIEVVADDFTKEQREILRAAVANILAGIE